MSVFSKLKVSRGLILALIMLSAPLMGGCADVLTAMGENARRCRETCDRLYLDTDGDDAGQWDNCRRKC